MARLAPSLVRLWKEVDTRWPHRDHWSDGWLGDDSHATRFSDHNPDASGWVHATDTDATLTHVMGSGPVGDELCVALLRLARSGKSPINYIIYKGIIYSRSYGFRAHRYTGLNSHHSHVHCSILRTSWARSWSGSWGVLVPTIDASAVKHAFDGHPTSAPVNVARVQILLRDRGLLRWPYIVGRAGSKTRNAMKVFQRRNGYNPDGVPGKPSLVKLAGGRYRVID